jgi:Phage tail assembly chaperone
MLDRATILSKKALKRETVDVPEWGGQVLVRELTAAERTRYEMGMSDMVQGEQTNPLEKVKRYENMRARIASIAVINEDGTRVFKDDDVSELNELSGNALDRISSVILRLSGYTREEAERLKKTSPPEDASISGSHLH